MRGLQHYLPAIVLLGSAATLSLSLAQGTVGPIVFAEGEENVEPVNPTDRFVTGAPIIYAFFEFENLVSTDVLSGVWYQGDSEVLSQAYTVNQVLGRTGEVPEGKMFFSLQFDNGAPPGKYRLEISLNGQLAQSATFSVMGAGAEAEAAPAGPAFDAPGLSEGRSADGTVATLHAIPAGVRELQLLVSHRGMARGTIWGWRISREGELVAEGQNLAWEGEADGLYLLPLELSWPDGVYDLDLFLEGERAASGSVVIGAPEGRAGVGETDDFEDSASGWGTGELDFGRIAYEQGQLVMTVTDDATPIWSVGEGIFGDAVFEVDAATLGGPEDNAYGIVVRYQDGENFYAFLTSADGYYAALHFEGNRLVWDQQWTFDDTSLLAPSAGSRRLRVLSDGAMLRFYIDGQLKVVLADALWSSGQSGLLAASTGQPGVVVGFDNWRAWPLADTEGVSAP